MAKSKPDTAGEPVPKQSQAMKLGAGKYVRDTSARQGRESTVTGKWDRKVVGYYAEPDEVLDMPKFMDALQKDLGVNVIIMNHPVTYPKDILELNPLRERDSYIGLGHTEDDSDLRQCIEEVHRRGMDFWLYYSGMHGAERHKQWCAVDFNGIPFSDLAPLPYAVCQLLVTYCPSRRDIREWNRAAYTFGALHYDIDAVYVTHFRYANPSFITNLFGCACESCEREAERKGYNSHAMRKACLSLPQKFSRMKAGYWKELAKLDFTLMDFITLLDDDRAVFDWLHFRASVVGDHLKLIRNSISACSGKKFITDTHPPTTALLVGHNYSDLQNGGADGFMPLSWLDTQLISAVAAWAHLLTQWVPGLDEAASLDIVKSFFGLRGIPLHGNRIDDLGIKANWYEPNVSWNATAGFYDHYSQEEVYALADNELTRLSMLNVNRHPVFPVIKGREWERATCERLIERALALGCAGYVFQWVDNFIDISGLT